MGQDHPPTRAAVGRLARSSLSRSSRRCCSREPSCWWCGGPGRRDYHAHARNKLDAAGGACELLAVLLDVGRVLDLLPGDSRFEALGPDLDSTERHKGQVAADEALLDGRELRLVRLGVDVDVLELAAPLAVAVYQHPAVPLGDVPLGLLLVLSDLRLGILLVLGGDVQLGILAGARSSSYASWSPVMS